VAASPARPACLTSASAFNVQSGTISAILGGSAGLNKTTAGTVTLTGMNTYTGATTITAGMLALSGTGRLGATATTIDSGAALEALGTTNSTGGSLMLNSGGTISLQNSAINTLDGATLTVGSGTGTLSIDVGSLSGQNSDLISLTGAATLTGAVTVNVNSLAGAAAGTSYTFISASSGLSASDFTLGTLTGTLAGDTAAFTPGSGNSVVLTFTAANGYYYTGATSTVFTDPTNYNTTATSGVAQSIALGSSTNVFIGTTTPTPTNITPAVTSNVTINSLTFTPSGSGGLISGGSTLTIDGGVTVQTGVTGTETISAFLALGGNQTWTVTDAASTLDIESGGLSGAFALTKAGAGTLILGAADTYTGATTVSAGALKITNSASLADTSSVTVASGAALQLSGGQIFSAVGTTLNGTGLSGNGALESVSDLNTYSGSITLGSNATIGSDVGSTLNLTGATITGTGFNLTLTGVGGGNVASAINTGAGTLTKTGSGTWTLTGANTFTGATTISSGTLAIGTGGNLAFSSGITVASGATFSISAATGPETIKDLSGVSGSSVLLGDNALTLGTANSTTFAGVISDGGGGSLVKVGTGVLTLSGTNTYAGGTTINGGEVKVASVVTNLGSGPLTLGGGELLTTTTSSAANTGTLNAGANIIAAATTTTATYSGAIGGTGSVTLGDATDTGTIILSANNNYSGTTTIGANTTAQLGASGATGSFGTGAVTDNGTIDLNKTGAYTYTNATSGTGSLVQSGTGTATITNTNTYVGGTTIDNGAISVGSVDINLGTGNLTIGGGELITTTTAVATNKTVTLNAGTDTIAAQTATTAVYDGVIGGTGALTVGDGTNAGLVVLGATNTYSGGTTISDGTLKIGTGSTTGSITGNVTDNSALVFNHIGNFTYGGVISGTGTVNSTEGTLILTGTNTYNGATSITAGTLELSGTGSIANSALTVGSGTTLAAVGTTNGVGALTIDSGSVNLQNGANNTLDGTTLTVTANGGTLAIDVGATAGTSDLLDLSSTAAFNGTPLTVDIDSLGSAAIGTHYTFLTAAPSSLAASDFTGVLSGSLAGMGDTVAFGISGDSVYLQINGAPLDSYYYTGATSTDFTNVNNFNTTATGGVVQSTPLSAASDVFIGTTTPTPTNKTPTLGSNLTINTLTFTPTGSGATLSGAGTLTIMDGITVQTGVAGTETISTPVALGASQTWTVTDTDSTLVGSGVISGAFVLTKAGAGTLLLSAANTYSGGTTVSAGTLAVGGNTALGTGPVALSGGSTLEANGMTITLGNALTLSGDVTLSGNLNLDGATLMLTGSSTVLTVDNSVTITGTISGTSNLTQAGPGTLTLTGTNNSTGGTDVTMGTLVVNSSSNLSSGPVTLAGDATLQYTGGAGALAQAITVTTGNSATISNTGGSVLTLSGNISKNGSNLDLSGGEFVVSGVISGSLADSDFDVTGASTVGLTSANTYNGPTVISGGSTLLTGIDNALPTPTYTNLTLGATGETSGTTNTLDLLGSSQTVNSLNTAGNGTNQIISSDGSASPTPMIGAEASAAAGSLTVDYSGGTTDTFSGSLGGAGAATNFSLTKSGTGTLALTGANTYSGGTTISAGTLEVGGTSALGTGNVTQNGGTLMATGTGGTQMNVIGDFTQNAGGTLEINLASGSSYDVLNVTGPDPAELKGNLVLNFNFHPMTGQSFTVVTTANGIDPGTLSASYLDPTILMQPGIVATGMLTDADDDLTLTITSTQLTLSGLLGSYSTPNRVAVLNYIDSNVLSGPLLSAITTALGGANLPATVANIADQMNPEKFANFVRETIINNAVFSTQLDDNYFESQRSANGDFMAANGQIDSSGLTIAGPNVDPSLASVSSRLLAWSPAPLAHGLLSDSSDPVVAGVDMKEMKTTPAPAPGPEHNFSTFIAGNVVLGQDFSQTDLAHADTTSGGVQLGADYRITPHLRVGALFGYNHTDGDLDDNGSKATIDSYAPGAYQPPLRIKAGTRTRWAVMDSITSPKTGIFRSAACLRLRMARPRATRSWVISMEGTIST
jgi:fibronectin-binding autotransporter adhesin